jgi:hypothetical protein
MTPDYGPGDLHDQVLWAPPRLPIRAIAEPNQAEASARKLEAIASKEQGEEGAPHAFPSTWRIRRPRDKVQIH